MREQIEILLNASRYKMICAREKESYGEQAWAKARYYEALVSSLEHAFVTISAIDRIKCVEVK